MGMLRQVEEARNKNTIFYDGLKSEWDMHGVGDFVMSLGDFSGHICRHIDVFNVIRVSSGERTMCV